MVGVVAVEVVCGVVTVCVVVVAVGGVLGLITSYNTFWRLWTHRIIAILMVAALALHWLPFLPAATLFLVGVCVAGMAHLKLVSSLVSLSEA